MVASGFDGCTLAPLYAANQADAFDFQQSSRVSVSAGCLGPIDYPSLAQACKSISDAQIALHAKTQLAAQKLGNARSSADEMSDISPCKISATSSSAFVAPASSSGGAQTAMQAISSSKCVSPPLHLLAARPSMTLLQELRTETQKEVEFLESLLLQFTHHDVGEEYMPQGGTAYIGEPIQGYELQVSQLAPTSAIGNLTLDEVAVLQDAKLQINMASNVPDKCTLSAQQSKDDQQQHIDDLEQQAVLLKSQKSLAVSEAAYAQSPSSGMPFSEPGTSVTSSQQSLEPTICPFLVEVVATTAQLSMAGGLDVGKTSSLQIALEAAQHQLALAVKSQEQLAALISQIISFDMPHLVSSQWPLEAIRTAPMVVTIDFSEVLAAVSATMSATVSVDASDDSSASLTPSISVTSDASQADFFTPSQSIQAFEITPFLGNVKQTDIEAAVDLTIQAPSSCFADGAATDLAISGKGVVPTS